VGFCRLFSSPSNAFALGWIIYLFMFIFNNLVLGSSREELPLWEAAILPKLGRSNSEMYSGNDR